MEFHRFDTETGKFTTVHDFDESISSINIRYKDAEARIKYLEEENKELRDEAYKDNELQKMKEKVSEMEDEMHRSFRISKEEQGAIEKWEKEHEEEVHRSITHKKRFEPSKKASGAAGGRYSYHFYPTAIGSAAVVECGCGAKFEFRSIM